MDSFLLRCNIQEGDLISLFREADAIAKEEIMQFVMFRIMRMQKEQPDNLVKIPVIR